ncbi:RagB/SusD family nutrient uptake outer membrane protein [Neolewinella lacunae]|uniref:RagB/SusD family nutrient uptake outer membrane protein n=1 Tax=Neolewinella lacunae TaxID=1517758 RepID=A0A923PKR5_9BACT|nr:RagB/SusD family nutrient uptake outer membrane protein [Neolewinella lacunae]MBC6994506.1 RagB/SusD family nutrient uptake outer membrane protein [Neolewinella lacunae]MDN3634199.1 RagB/SusD family nutrient uptake outer membrane protein [Neolewinella lacunae]
MTLFLGASCTDFLTDLSPAQSLPSSEAFNRAADLETALIGGYNALQSSDLGATGFAINANVLSDNAEWRGSFPSYIDMYNRQLTAANPEIGGMWAQGYIAINHANLVLQGLTTVDDPALTTALANRLRGEALFLRGMIHFEMVRYYGQPWGASSSTDLGIPVVTMAVDESTDITFPARNTVAEVYAQAIADLTEAASLLAPTGARGRANGTAATAYLAEIAFQQRDYPQAAALAQTVIEAGYDLTASPEIPFINEGSSEEIMAVINTVQDNPGVNGSLATFHHINGRGGDVVVNPDLKENGYLAVIPAEQLAEAGPDTLIDLRSALLTSSDIFNVEKYEDFTNNADDLMLVRSATFYLMRAEALARINGINAESLELLNTIRNRSIRRVNAAGEQSDASDIVSYEASDFADADALIEAIILERRVELAFEGNRLHDLRRLQREVRGVPFNADILLFPIPQREIDANDMLVQNPGY